MRQDPDDVGRVQVVQEAVDQDEIEPLVVRDLVRRHIRGDERAAMALSRTGDVLRIDVDAEVVSGLEVWRIRAGAAADVQDSSNPTEVVMRPRGAQLLLGIGRYPQPVHPGLLHDPFEERVQSSHLTSKGPTDWASGNRVRRASCRSSGISPENSGAVLITTTVT